jgi:hypothetical protein
LIRDILIKMLSNFANRIKRLFSSEPHQANQKSSDMPKVRQEEADNRFGVLTGQEILDEGLIIDGFKPDCLKAASYDLRLGNKVATFKSCGTELNKLFVSGY